MAWPTVRRMNPRRLLRAWCPRLSALVLPSLLVLVVVAPNALGAHLRVSHVKRISSGTPFPGPCGLDSPIVTVDAEVEPQIEVDPGDPRRLAVTWMQDSGRSNIVLSSRDRGRTWTRAFVPGLSQCTGGVEPTAADPWLSFGGDGRLYLASVTGTISTTANRAALRADRTSSVRISRSRDGGRSWSTPRTVADVNGEAFLPTVAVAGDGTVGVLYYGTQRDRAGDAEWTTDVRFSYSRDRGRHWRARRIAGPFDMNTAESHGGELFVGDYEGLAPLPQGFAAAFAQARTKAKHGPSDIFFARLHVRP
jgi:hypothetical protein